MAGETAASGRLERERASGKEEESPMRLMGLNGNVWGWVGDSRRR